MKLIFFLLPLLLGFASSAEAQRPLEHFAERPEVREFVVDMHDKHGFAVAPLLRLFSQAEPQPKAIKAIMPPRDPGIRSWRTYRSRYVEPVRIEGGLRFWARNQIMLEAARQRYGVPEEIIVAIIGVETIYGRQVGKFPTLATLATLAFDYPPRAPLFRSELEAFLLLARESHQDALSYRSSYAGALGLPQFLPSSVRNWGVDFDGDGRIDLADSEADSIGSVANFLRSHGWEADGPVAVPASVSGERYAELITAGIQPRYMPNELVDFGVTVPPSAPQLPCALIDLVSPNEVTEYWLGYANFYALTRYNRSSFYAMVVYALSQELASKRQRPNTGAY